MHNSFCQAYFVQASLILTQNLSLFKFCKKLFISRLSDGRIFASKLIC